MIERKVSDKTTISVTTDDFLNGWEAGYLRFVTEQQGKPITKQINNVHNPSLYNAG
jgi:hypothetical protein